MVKDRNLDVRNVDNIPCKDLHFCSFWNMFVGVATPLQITH